MTREQILADILTMIQAMPDYHSLSILQTIVEDAGKEYTILHLAEYSLGDGKFRLDYVVNKSNTENRFMIEIYADGIGGEFFHIFKEITDVIVTEYNASQYDV